MFLLGVPFNDGRLIHPVKHLLDLLTSLLKAISGSFDLHTIASNYYIIFASSDHIYSLATSTKIVLD